jgi:hypothetical protein
MENRRCSVEGCQRVLVHNNISGFCIQHKSEYEAQYYQKHKAHIKNCSTQYHKEHQEHYKRINAEWSQKNKHKKNAWKKQKQKNDMQYKIKCYLRTRVRNAIKKGTRSGSAVKDLGCTIAELKTHLESKFLPGMTWDNWSKTGWHIDHIEPLSNFDLTNRDEFLKACHYTNLQPLWAEDNLSKSNKFPCLNPTK